MYWMASIAVEMLSCQSSALETKFCQECTVVYIGCTVVYIGFTVVYIGFTTNSLKNKK